MGISTVMSCKSGRGNYREEKSNLKLWEHRNYRNVMLLICNDHSQEIHAWFFHGF